MNRLALGTAQFGMPYGMTNRGGRPGQKTVKAVLQQAKAAGMDTLDTAIDYGDCETVLGRAGINDWRVITKLPAVPDDVTDVVEWTEQNVDQSMRRLQVDCLHGLLLHRPGQLMTSRGAKVYQVLEDLKCRGLVHAIGVSIYEPQELDTLSSHYHFDLVQTPLNIFNQQLLQSGWLHKLKPAGTEIHVRSVFLQGLLLLTPDELPEQFGRWRSLWDRWYAWLGETGLTPLQACLRFVLSQKEIDRVIVGIENRQQLRQIVDAAEDSLPGIPADMHCNDPDLTNPTRWQAS